MEYINRCAVHLVGQIIFLLGIDEANCVWSQTRDSPEENNKLLKCVASKTYVLKLKEHCLFSLRRLRVNGLFIWKVLL